LKVSGRTTSFNLARVGSSNQQIAELAGTQYVLNGTFCREGLDLTLEAELTNREGFIEWRGNFTQTTNRFDQVEQQLATLVANGVAVELGDVIQGRPDDPVKRQALEQLLIGQEYEWEGEADQAREAYTRALEHQPDYAEAVWGLAMLEVDDGDLFNVGSSIEKFWPLGEKALNLALTELERGVPDFKAHWVAGQILHTLARLNEALTWRKANELSEEEIKTRKAEAKAQFKEAEQHFRSAIVLNPSEYWVRDWLATNLDRQGMHRGAEALDILLEGQDLDPFNPGFARKLANRLTQRGHYRQAMELLDRFNALPKEKRRPLYFTRLEIMNNLGRIDEKLAAQIEILETDPAAVPGSDPMIHIWWTVSEIAELGLYEEAEQLYRQVAEIPFTEDDSWRHEFFFEDTYLIATGRKGEVVDKNMARISDKSDAEILDAWYVEVSRSIWTFWDAGEQERAIRLYEALRHHEHAPTWAERQTWAALSLAQMYREVRREAEVPVLLNEVVEYLETELDAGIRHPFVISTLAEAYALQGNDEDALETLRLAVDYGYCRLPIRMKRSPFTSNWWDQFMDNPDFLQSMDRMHACIEQQASNVRNLLARYDMEELLVPVIEAAQRTGTSQP
jgi:tetratricopeptide (TPR) repeat protein